MLHPQRGATPSDQDGVWNQFLEPCRGGKYAVPARCARCHIFIVTIEALPSDGRTGARSLPCAVGWPWSRSKRARRRGDPPPLDYAPGTPVEQLGRAAIDDLLDRGDLDDWSALAAAIRQEPWGEVANTILQLCRAHPMYGTSILWPAFVAARRADGLGGSAASWPRVRGRLGLGELRRSQGRSQAVVGRELGMNQSEVSKLEARADARIRNAEALRDGDRWGSPADRRGPNRVRGGTGARQQAAAELLARSPQTDRRRGRPTHNVITMQHTEHLTAVIEREGDGFVALCPELDIASQGDSVEQATSNLREALSLFFESASASEVEERLHREVYVTHVDLEVG